jgi:hypothetical protein
VKCTEGTIIIAECVGNAATGITGVMDVGEHADQDHVSQGHEQEEARHQRG